MGWLGKQKTKHANLGLHEILIECNDNQKTTVRWCLKMNVRAQFLNFPYENDLFFFLIIIQKLRWKLEKLETKGHEPT